MSVDSFDGTRPLEKSGLKTVYVFGSFTRTVSSNIMWNPTRKNDLPCTNAFQKCVLVK